MAQDPRSEFMQAYAPCHEPFARYCAALAYGRMDAQDLMQDVLLSAFQRFDGIRRKDQLLHYLIRAARNRAASTWRIGKRYAAITEAQAAKLQAAGASAEMLVDADLLYRAMDKLPAAQHEALVLFEVSGLSMAEIAAIQGSNENAVKTKVSRARAALRGLMEDRSAPNHLELVRSIALLLLLP